VLRTALTYLELMGVLRAGTPIYTGYDLKPLLSIHEIAERFPGQHSDFVRQLFGLAKKGRIWFGLNPDDAALRLGVERKRVVRAIDVMEQQGLVEVKAGDVRTPYTRQEIAVTKAEIIADLVQKFQRREDQEIARIKQVVDLIELDGCQVNALVGYFGENRMAPCGHCSWCGSRKPRRLPQSERVAIKLSAGDFEELRKRCPKELQTPRQFAKLLCGLGSPSFTRAKLTRDKLFGSLEQHRFADVVEWCQGQE